MKRGQRVFLKVKGGRIRGKITNIFKGNYFKGKKRIGIRTFIEIKAGGQTYVLTTSEAKKRITKRLI